MFFNFIFDFHLFLFKKFAPHGAYLRRGTFLGSYYLLSGQEIEPRSFNKNDVYLLIIRCHLFCVSFVKLNGIIKIGGKKKTKKNRRLLFLVKFSKWFFNWILCKKLIINFKNFCLKKNKNKKLAPFMKLKMCWCFSNNFDYFIRIINYNLL